MSIAPELKQARIVHMMESLETVQHLCKSISSSLLMLLPATALSLVALRPAYTFGTMSVQSGLNCHELGLELVRND